MDERKRKKANLVRLLIAQGWNPPTPTSKIVAAIAEDIERVSTVQDARIEQFKPTLTLTPGELRVLTFASQGYTMPETAKLLDKSLNTIKAHMKNALNRLGAKNQAHAVAICIRNGLIDPQQAEKREAA